MSRRKNQLAVKFEYFGNPDFRTYYPHKYNELKEEFPTIGSPAEYKMNGNVGKKWVILLDEMKFKITLIDDRVLTVKLGRGFVTDFGSTSDWMEWLIDGESLEMELPSLVHDALFITKELDFKETNQIFYDYMRFNGVNKIKAQIAFGAVSSPVAKKYFDEYKPRDRNQPIEIIIQNS